MLERISRDEKHSKPTIIRTHDNRQSQQKTVVCLLGKYLTHVGTEGIPVVSSGRLPSFMSGKPFDRQETNLAKGILQLETVSRWLTKALSKTFQKKYEK